MQELQSGGASWMHRKITFSAVFYAQIYVIKSLLGQLLGNYYCTKHYSPSLILANTWLLRTWRRTAHLSDQDSTVCLGAEFKRAVLHILPSPPKCSSRHFIFHRNFWVIFVIRVPSTPSYTTVFSSQKPFYTQPNYSSWWLGIFLAVFSRGGFSGLTFLKAICLGVFTGRCWNAGVFPIWQLLIARDNFRLLTSVLLLA